MDKAKNDNGNLAITSFSHHLHSSGIFFLRNVQPSIVLVFDPHVLVFDPHVKYPSLVQRSFYSSYLDLQVIANLFTAMKLFNAPPIIYLSNLKQ